MKITWEKQDPKKYYAFATGRTEEHIIEVYRHPDPTDMRRSCYQVNIWLYRHYNLINAAPIKAASGRGSVEDGKRKAEEMLK